MNTAARDIHQARAQYAPGGHHLTPPTKPPCDQCQGPVSRYNPTGRCHQCTNRYGEPPAGHGTGPRAEGHAPDCTCKARSHTRGRRRVVTVKCPVCRGYRDVDATGRRLIDAYGAQTSRRAAWCRYQYSYPCRECALAARVGRPTRAGGAATVAEEWLRAVAEWVAVRGEAPSQNDWVRGRMTPSIYTVRREYGSWGRGLAAAGLTAQSSGRRVVEREAA